MLSEREERIISSLRRELVRLAVERDAVMKENFALKIKIMKLEERSS